MVLYKLYVFCSGMKFKMAATAGLNLTLDPMGKMFQNAFSLKPLGQLKPNCPGMIIGRSSTKFVFYVERKSKMAATAIHRLTLDPMGKCSNAFFSETTNIIKAKLYMNVHWMVLYKFYVFCSGMKFKMAATAGLSLTLDPMGKMFQNASSLKPLGQLKPNKIYVLIIGWSSTKYMFFMSIGNPRWPPHRLTLDNWNQTAQEWSLEGPLQNICFLCRSKIQDGRHRRT